MEPGEFPAGNGEPTTVAKVPLLFTRNPVMLLEEGTLVYTKWLEAALGLVVEVGPPPQPENPASSKTSNPGTVPLRGIITDLRENDCCNQLRLHSQSGVMTNLAEVEDHTGRNADVILGLAERIPV